MGRLPGWVRFWTLGWARLSPLTSCRSFGYAASVCYIIDMNIVIWVQKGTYRGILGILGVTRSGGPFLVMLLCSNSRLVYIYTLPELQTGLRESQLQFLSLLSLSLLPHHTVCVTVTPGSDRKVPARHTERGSVLMGNGWGRAPHTGLSCSRQPCLRPAASHEKIFLLCNRLSDEC